VHGDFTRVDVLRDSRIEYAAKVIVVADSTVERSDQDTDARSVLAALTVERLNPEIYTCVELLSAENAPHLAVAGIEEVVVPADFGSHLMSGVAMYRGLMPVIKDLFDRGAGQELHVIGVPSELAEKTFRDLYLGLKERWNSVPIALIYFLEDGGHRVITNPVLDTQLSGGEAVVVISPVDHQGLVEEYPAPEGAWVS
jgi:voltage-gated potassium channel